MLQGIGNQTDLYSAYNRIQTRRFDEDGMMKRLSSQEQQPSSNKQVVSDSHEMDLRLDSIRPRKDVSIEDISLSLNEQASTFEMKGRNSDIELLDMEKAVSDMQKDKALMQYQYFVGDSNPFLSNEDGVVIPK